MKRIGSIILLAAALCAASCNGSKDIPTAEFGKVLYTVYAGGTVTVDVVLSEAPATSVSVPIVFGGNAVVDADYSVSSKSVNIPAGQARGALTLTDISLSTEKSVSLEIGPVNGYVGGTNYKAVVALDSREALIYSFKAPEAYLYESYKVSVKLKGVESGDSFKAAEDIEVPLMISGEGAPAVRQAGALVVKAGENTGTATLNLASASFNGDSEIEITADPSASRFITGDKSVEKVHVMGNVTPDRLVGTYVFDKVYSLEEVEYFYTEMEEDPADLPTHNTGFTLSFRKESDGSVTLVPGGNGDFNNFFREAKVSLAAPVHFGSSGYSLGNNSSEESNMFIANENPSDVWQQFCYYKLSNANRSFDNFAEGPGEAVIAIRLRHDGDIDLVFNDYDEPPFGFLWWEDDSFDTEIFGFASHFKKQ